MSERVVYSTDSGRINTCPDCGQAYKNCHCDQPELITNKKKSDGIIHVSRERKGRGGKTVTLITGLAEKDQAPLGQDLKKLCGSGGTIKEGNIEIQGDHCTKVEARLRSLGYKVKHIGG